MGEIINLIVDDMFVETKTGSWSLEPALLGGFHLVFIVCKN